MKDEIIINVIINWDTYWIIHKIWKEIDTKRLREVFQDAASWTLFILWKDWYKINWEINSKEFLNKYI